MVGRITLVQSVMSSMAVHLMQMSYFLEYVVQELDRLSKNFI